jgi:hypothetical protein
VGSSQQQRILGHPTPRQGCSLPLASLRDGPRPALDPGRGPQPGACQQPGSQDRAISVLYGASTRGPGWSVTVTQDPLTCAAPLQAWDSTNGKDGIEAAIGLAVPGRPIGPWSRRTEAPEASATDGTGPWSVLGPWSTGSLRARAVTDGHQRRSDGAGQPVSTSSSSQCHKRIRLWSRRAGVRVPSSASSRGVGTSGHRRRHLRGQQRIPRGSKDPADQAASKVLAFRFSLISPCILGMLSRHQCPVGR